MLMLAPTLAPVLKLPVPIAKTVEFVKELTVELPTLIEELTLVRFTIPSEVTAVEFATKFDPTV